MSERTEDAEHEHADEGLHQSEELVRALLSATGEGIYGVDLDGTAPSSTPPASRCSGTGATGSCSAGTCTS